MLSIMKLFEYADAITLPNGKHLDQTDKHSYPIWYMDDLDFFLGDDGGTHISSLENYFDQIGNEEYKEVRYSDNTDDLDDFLYNILENATYTGRIWLDDKIMAFWDLNNDVISRLRLKDIIKKLEEKLKVKINPNEWWLEFSDTTTAIPYFVILNDFIENNDLKYGIMGEDDKVSSEVRKAWHLLDSKDKLKLKTQYGMDKYELKTKPLSWKQALLKSESVLNENPDYIKKYHLEFYDNESLAFGYYKDKMYVNEKLHGEHVDLIDLHLIRNDFKFPGRLWTNNKVISFWLYPDRKEFLKVLKDIEEEVYDITFDKEWLVEVVDENDGYKESDFVSIEEYYGSPNWYEEEINSEHEKSPMEKTKKIGKFLKVKPLAWKQALLKSESLRDKMTPVSEEYMRKKAREIFGIDGDTVSIKIWNPHGYKLTNNISGIEEENYRVNHHKLTGDVLTIYNFLHGYLQKFPGGNINNIERFLIKENNNPNELLLNDEKLNWYNKDARSFSFIGNKGYLSDYRTTHINLPFKYGKEDFKHIIGYDEILKINDAKKIRNGMEYSGRIWDKHLIISFWDYPETKEKLINLLDILKKEDNTLDYHNYLISLPDGNFIGINEYYNNRIKQNVNIDHINSPLNKKRNSISGFGSYKNRPIEWKYKIYQEKMNKINERVEAKMELPQDVLDFQKMFDKKGYKLYVVGGAVRDFLMGKKPHDFDMVTDTTPENVMKLLKDYKTDLQGVQFGVVRVFTNDEPMGYEIASYRKDISKGRDTKGTDSKVETGSHITIKDDVRRRDLTINALFYNIKTGEIVDVVGGMKDIKDKIVKAVGVPQKRFNEDRLRILRALRFAAVTHSTIDPRTERAIKKDNRLFGISPKDDVSRERIFMEFNKVKDKARDQNDPQMIKIFIDLLIEYEIMEQIFPVDTKHKTIRPTTYLTVAIAQVLRDNKITSKFKRILIDSKIPTHFVEIISILIKLWQNQKIDPDEVYELYKEVRNKGVRRDILEEWIHVMGITDKSIIRFLDYEPSTPGKEVMDDGFRRSDIGKEIRKRESDKFKKILKESYIIKSFNDYKKFNF